ncbi:unnamed protein product, partial [Amoebophrya sp. A120]
SGSWWNNRDQSCSASLLWARRPEVAAYHSKRKLRSYCSRSDFPSRTSGAESVFVGDPGRRKRGACCG